MFRKNDLELDVFNRKVFIFFSSKVFSNKDRMFESKKNRKKKPFQKSGWVLMDSPIYISSKLFHNYPVYWKVYTKKSSVSVFWSILF
jgi:hypothetical protein